MQPKFIQLLEKKVIGVGGEFIPILSPGKNNMVEIPKLWHQFITRIGEISNRVGQASFGVVESLQADVCKPNPHAMFYIACTEVSAVELVPSGMVHRTIPAGRYASFTHKGKLDSLGQTMKFIFGNWLPTSGVKRRNAQDIEVYDSRFDLNSDDSEFDILIPVV